MFGQLIVVFVVAECDRCGVKHDKCATLHDARDNATLAGWKIYDWLFEGCPRQTIFCRDCVEALNSEVQDGSDSAGAAKQAAVDG